MSMLNTLERVKKNTPWATERIERIEQFVQLVESGMNYIATCTDGQELRGHFIFERAGIAFSSNYRLYYLSELESWRPVLDLTEVKQQAKLDANTCLAEFELRGSAFNALYSFASKNDVREFTRMMTQDVTIFARGT